jgi:hypothetical protein
MMFEFVKFPEKKPDKAEYYYTYCLMVEQNNHAYMTIRWTGNNWDTKHQVLGYIPESCQHEYLQCVFWSSDNKIKPF